jgi:hypothetical protein
MAPSLVKKRSTHTMETRSRTRSKKFPMNRIPVDLRIKIYELAHYRNVNSLANGVYYQIPWGRTILFSGILNDLEALDLAAIKGEEQRDNMCTILAGTGNLKALKWIRREKETRLEPNNRSRKSIRLTPCSFDDETCPAAARGGHLEVLKWLHEQGSPWDHWTTAAAAFGGHFEVLQWLQKQQCPLNISSCNLAARAGNFEILQWLHQKKYPFNADTCEEASRAGHLEILKWLHKKKCPWDTRTTKNMAVRGNLEALKWLRKRNCPWSGSVCSKAAERGDRRLLDWAINNGCPLGGYWSADQWRSKCDLINGIFPDDSEQSDVMFD